MKTSRIKINVPKTVKLVYKLVDRGEVFLYDGGKIAQVACMKLDEMQYINLHNGTIGTLEPELEVVMLEAELLLKFRGSDA